MFSCERSYAVCLCSRPSGSIAIWAATWQNQHNDCAQRRLWSAWASAQSDQSSLCAQWVAKDPSFLHANSPDWSNWADAQAHLSLRLAHTHVVAFDMSRLISVLSTVIVSLCSVNSNNQITFFFFFVVVVVVVVVVVLMFDSRAPGRQ